MMSAVLTAVLVALLAIVIVQQVVFNVCAGKADTAEENLSSLQSQISEAQKTNDELQTKTDKNYVKWRNAQGLLACEGDESGKVCYITFDGGPSSEQTEENLSILSEHGAVATWFCMADEEDLSYLDLSLVSTIEQQGSAVGILGWNESETYEFYWGTLDEYLEEDFDKAEKALESAAGHEIEICRFQGGSTKVAYYNSELADKLPKKILNSGYQYFDWNVSGEDGGKASADKIADNVLSEAKKYAKTESPICVQLHDDGSSENTTKALPEILDGLEELGYSFEVLDKDTAGFYQRSIVSGS